MSSKHSRYAFTTERAANKIALLLELLKTPMTRIDLAEKMSLNVRSVQAYLSMLMEEKERRIHIKTWKRNEPGSPSPVYAAGPGQDCRKPRPFTNAQQLKRKRVRQKCDPEIAFDDMARKRMARIKPRRDPMITALFGSA